MGLLPPKKDNIPTICWNFQVRSCCFLGGFGESSRSKHPSQSCAKISLALAKRRLRHRHKGPPPLSWAGPELGLSKGAARFDGPDQDQDISISYVDGPFRIVKCKGNHWSLELNPLTADRKNQGWNDALSMDCREHPFHFRFFLNLNLTSNRVWTWTSGSQNAWTSEQWQQNPDMTFHYWFMTGSFEWLLLIPIQLNSTIPL